MPANTRCVLNSDGTVCLKDILESFNCSIKEENAWALCYQCAKCCDDTIRTTSLNKLYKITEIEHIFLHSDGTVHTNSIFAGGGKKSGLYNFYFC